MEQVEPLAVSHQEQTPPSSYALLSLSDSGHLYDNKPHLTGGSVYQNSTPFCHLSDAYRDVGGDRNLGWCADLRLINAPKHLYV